MAEINAPLEQLEREPSLLHRGMLLELGEIDHYFKASTVESFKNIISTSIDQVRLPYARKPQRMPRRFVMFGTTNRSQFLVDPTGNRRFVPLEIPIGFEVPWQRVEEERDQLWSAALLPTALGLSTNTAPVRSPSCAITSSSSTMTMSGARTSPATCKRCKKPPPVMCSGWD